jgi:hypothetical protein
MFRNLFIYFLTILSPLFLSPSFAQDIPNASFENWTNGEPVNWHTTNQSILGTQFDVVNKETSNPQSGQFSARIEVVTKNIFLVGPVTVPGVLTLSEISIDIFQQSFNISGGYPFSGMPQQLAGYLKYQPSGIDTSYFGFALTRWNNGTRDTIGYAADTISGTISSWTPFQLPIAYDIWVAPDTMSILFLCTNVNDPVVHTGSKMWVDNLSFIYGTVGIEGITFGDDYRIYADPATRQLIIDTKFDKPRLLDVQLFNVSGQSVARFDKTMEHSREYLDTGHLTAGTYILRITEQNKILDTRKIHIMN